MKTYPGADCSSDHVLVVATIGVKLKSLRKRAQKPRRQLQLLTTKEMKNHHNLIVRNRYDKLKEEDQGEQGVEHKWHNLEKAIKEGNGIHSSKKIRARKAWMIEILNKMKKQQKGRNEYRYKMLNIIIHRECTKAKERWMNDNCKKIEELEKRDQQLMYEKVKEITYKKKAYKSTAIKTADGTVIPEAEAVMERWVEYIAKLFNDNRVEHLDTNINGDQGRGGGSFEENEEGYGNKG